MKETIIKSSLQDKIDAFLEKSRSEEQVKKIIVSFEEMVNKMQLIPEDILEYYDCTIHNSGKEENLAVEFSTERIKEENVLGLPTFRIIPTRFSPMTNGLRSSIIYTLKPINTALPMYEFLFVFIYSDTYMYIFHAEKEYRFKGWNKYVRQNATSYSYKKIVYSKYTEDMCQTYLKDRFKESIDFMEKSLGKVVE